MNNVFNFKNVKHDISSGFTVFFIALPLCLGIALASGAPLYSGVLTGIIGGLMVSLVSKSVYSVSGPAAGLSTIVAAAILSLGDFQLFLLSVMVAGFFQLTIGIFKLGAFANYFPSSVIKGMLAAIGIILIAKQIPLAMGYDKSNFWSNLITSEIADINNHIAPGVILISLISMTLLIVLQQPFAKKLKAFPAALLVVIVGVIINALWTYEHSTLALNEKQLVYIPSNMFASITFPDFTKIFSSMAIWKNGLVIGIVATLETLLCVEAVDKLDPHKRTTPVNRELIAQGLGNLTCGLLGGIPMTAVIVRGSANINAGAKSKFSAFFHGLLLLLAVLFIPTLLDMIPYACLAAILLLTGYNLTKPILYKSLWKLGWQQFIPFMVTVIVILVEDLLIGVGVGLLASLYYIVQNNYKANYSVTKTRQSVTDAYTIVLHNNVSFLNKIKLKNELNRIPAYSAVTIDGSQSHFIDYDVLEAISEYAEQARDKHIELNLIGVGKVSVLGAH